ncbi:hypothetical protein P691DRAFT_783025 [Macrolepiota fuliginosa MF-IS2]|uniref:Uncharacterized protein n=1 Tax=Macrolepiota fuliginosa MF-IS2 TaxID=1400762 RepID=A0A9P5XK18_9AGAR|nr:hypothetical protein P691DRAFT_783025 [Macrolepiota fuliginosa MF-IS2]
MAGPALRHRMMRRHFTTKRSPGLPDILGDIARAAEDKGKDTGGDKPGKEPKEDGNPGHDGSPGGGRGPPDNTPTAGNGSSGGNTNPAPNPNGIPNNPPPQTPPPQAPPQVPGPTPATTAASTPPSASSPSEGSPGSDGGGRNSGPNSTFESSNGPDDNPSKSGSGASTPSTTEVTSGSDRTGSSPTRSTSLTSPHSPSSTPQATPTASPPGGSGTSDSNPSISLSSALFTPTDTTSSQSALASHSNRGAIAGGVVGALIFILVCAFALWFIHKRRRRKRVAPSTEFLNNPPSYPFARAGLGNQMNANEKTGVFGGTYGGAGKGAAGQAKFRPFSADSHEGILSDKQREPQMERFRDEKPIVPLPPAPQPEVLYSTPLRVNTTPIVPTARSSAPGTPTTPNGRRIPFGTGTFQFPPRSMQPQTQGQAI